MGVLVAFPSVSFEFFVLAVAVCVFGTVAGAPRTIGVSGVAGASITAIVEEQRFRARDAVGWGLNGGDATGWAFYPWEFWGADARVGGCSNSTSTARGCSDGSWRCDTGCCNVADAANGWCIFVQAGAMMLETLCRQNLHLNFSEPISSK